MTAVSIGRKQAQELYDFCKKHKVEQFLFAKDQGVYFCASTGSS